MKQKSEAPLKMPEMNDREKVETLYSIIAKTKILFNSFT